MSLLTAVVILLVGFVSGVVVRAIAGLAAIVALLLVIFGVAAPDIGLVDFIEKSRRIPRGLTSGRKPTLPFTNHAR